MTARRDFLAGVRDVSPMLLGAVPFGLVVGVTAVEAGIPPVQVVAMSVIVFAGASQLAAIDLLSRTAPVAVIVLTIVVVNLRLVMYSASIAPYFRRFPRPWQWLSAYVLTDQAYALSLAEYQRTAPGDRSRRWYYLGTASTLWVGWQVATVVGVVLGARIPPGLSLEFAVPLVFVALLVPALVDRPSALAAVVAGGVAVPGTALPLNLGIVTAAACGIAAGVLADRRAGRFPAAGPSAGDDPGERETDPDRATGTGGVDGEGDP